MAATSNPSSVKLNLSGAPDKTETTEQVQPIWDENNILVDPAAREHYKREAKRVLGELDDEENGDIEVVPPTTPAVYQRLDSQTEDVMSNPKPSADPNSMPTFSDEPSEGPKEIEKEVIAKAKVEHAQQQAETQAAEQASLDNSAQSASSPAKVQPAASKQPQSGTGTSAPPPNSPPVGSSTVVTGSQTSGAPDKTE